MCSRYISVQKPDVLEKRFNARAVNQDFLKPNYNIKSGSWAPVITSLNPFDIQMFSWGFTPNWSRRRMYITHARAEGDHNKADEVGYTGGPGIITQKMFQDAIRKRRCLVIADAFFECESGGTLDKPYLCFLQNKVRPFAFAGIWEIHTDSQGNKTPTFAIINTVANELMQKIGHRRTPVILLRQFEKTWLAQDTSLTKITGLLRPLPGYYMNAYPVAGLLKGRVPNNADVIKQIGPRILAQGSTEIPDALPF